MNSQNDLTPEEATELFGTPVEAAPPDDEEMKLALFLRHIRALLAEAAHEEKVGVNELASRLSVSPSVVSRLLRSDGDMRVSTAFMWACALGREWNIDLHKPSAQAASTNQQITAVINSNARTINRNAISSSGTAVINSFGTAGGVQIGRSAYEPSVKTYPAAAA
jgi:hypothetical protein